MNKGNIKKRSCGFDKIKKWGRNIGDRVENNGKFTHDQPTPKPKKRLRRSSSR